MYYGCPCDECDEGKGRILDLDLIELLFLKIVWEQNGVKSIQNTQPQYYLSFLIRKLESAITLFNKSVEKCK